MENQGIGWSTSAECRPADMMASSLDGHPNRDLHREVAELLYGQLREIDRDHES